MLMTSAIATAIARQLRERGVFDDADLLAIAIDAARITDGGDTPGAHDHWSAMVAGLGGTGSGGSGGSG